MTFSVAAHRKPFKNLQLPRAHGQKRADSDYSSGKIAERRVLDTPRSHSLSHAYLFLLQPHSKTFRSTMRKKAILASTLAVLVITLIAVFILLYVTGRTLGIISSGAERQLCAISAVIESSVKFGGVRTYEYKCPVELVQVSKSKAQKPINGDPNIENVYRTNPGFFDKVKDAEGERIEQFRLNEVMGKELKDCWEKTGRGRLDLFSDWWVPLKLGEEGSPEPDQSAWEGWLATARSVIHGYKGPPVNCIICSRIKFDEDFSVDSSSDPQGNDPFTLDTYLKNTPHPNPQVLSEVSGERMSLYEFLFDNDVNPELYTPSWKYDAKKDRPYAVVFARINVLKTTSAAQNAVIYSQDLAELFGINFEIMGKEGKSKPVDRVLLIPYDEVVKTCTQLAN